MSLKTANFICSVLFNEFGLLIFLCCQCHTYAFIFSMCIALQGDRLNWIATCVLIVYGLTIISTVIVTVYAKVYLGTDNPDILGRNIEGS